MAETGQDGNQPASHMTPQLPGDGVPPGDGEMVDAPVIEVHQDRDFVHSVQKVIRRQDADGAYALVQELHAADVADLLEVLPSGQRVEFIELLGQRIDPDVLAEVEGAAQDDLYEHMPNDQIADAVNDLETDDAVYVLEELDEEDRKEVLGSLDADDRVAIEESLSYPEDSAGRLMSRDFVALPEFWTVGQTIDFLRTEDADIPDDFYDIFVVDPGHKPVDTVPLSRVMRSARATSIGDIMDAGAQVVSASDDQEEVAYQFGKYHLISAGVVDASQRIVGVVTVDDVVDVISEEAQEDILALAGVSEESGVNENVFEVTKGRFAWLVVNLGTAILASIVIGLFDATIEQMVALAVLMPIVASMGGNAGTQTMTVAVRALATKELSATNAFRVINRELIAATVNGALLAVIAGFIAWFWFGGVELGVIFAAAMIFNIIVAGLSGVLVPLELSKAGADPAIASSVFVTTITDVFGFFAFLGLAAAFVL